VWISRFDEQFEMKIATFGIQNPILVTGTWMFSSKFRDSRLGGPNHRSDQWLSVERRIVLFLQISGFLWEELSIIYFFRTQPLLRTLLYQLTPMKGVLCLPQPLRALLFSVNLRIFEPKSPDSAKFAHYAAQSAFCDTRHMGPRVGTTRSEKNSSNKNNKKTKRKQKYSSPPKNCQISKLRIKMSSFFFHIPSACTSPNISYAYSMYFAPGNTRFRWIQAEFPLPTTSRILLYTPHTDNKHSRDTQALGAQYLTFTP
jgi:hypothetical protein